MLIHYKQLQMILTKQLACVWSVHKYHNNLKSHN